MNIEQDDVAKQEAIAYHEYYGNGAVKEWAYNVPNESHQMFVRMLLPVTPEIASIISPITRNLFEQIWSYHFESNEEYYKHPKCGKDPHTYSWIVDKQGMLDIEMGSIVMDDVTPDRNVVIQTSKDAINRLISNDTCAKKGK